MILSHIVAVAKNGVIGVGNDLPWHIPEDLKYFKEKTKNHIIIMGRKTFESIGKRALPNRLNIVITRNNNYEVPKSVQRFSSVSEALEFCSSKLSEWDPEIFICGGGELYKQTLAQVDKLYITEIDMEVPGGEAFYPLSELDDFILESEEPHINSPSFNFRVFCRR